MASADDVRADMLPYTASLCRFYESNKMRRQATLVWQQMGYPCLKAGPARAVVIFSVQLIASGVKGEWKLARNNRTALADVHAIQNGGFRVGRRSDGSFT